MFPEYSPGCEHTTGCERFGKRRCGTRGVGSREQRRHDTSPPGHLGHRTQRRRIGKQRNPDTWICCDSLWANFLFSVPAFHTRHEIPRVLRGCQGPGGRSNCPGGSSTPTRLPPRPIPVIRVVARPMTRPVSGRIPRNRPRGPANRPRSHSADSPPILGRSAGPWASLIHGSRQRSGGSRQTEASTKPHKPKEERMSGPAGRTAILDHRSSIGGRSWYVEFLQPTL